MKLIFHLLQLFPFLLKVIDVMREEVVSNILLTEKKGGTITTMITNFRLYCYETKLMIIFYYFRVEFMNKFYDGKGYLFVPFSFKSIEMMEDDEVH